MAQGGVQAMETMLYTIDHINQQEWWLKDVPLGNMEIFVIRVSTFARVLSVHNFQTSPGLGNLLVCLLPKAENCLCSLNSSGFCQRPYFFKGSGFGIGIRTLLQVILRMSFPLHKYGFENHEKCLLCFSRSMNWNRMVFQRKLIKVKGVAELFFGPIGSRKRKSCSDYKLSQVFQVLF